MNARIRHHRQSSAARSLALTAITVAGAWLQQAGGTRSAEAQPPTSPGATAPPPGQGADRHEAAKGGYVAVPPGSETLVEPMTENSVQLFASEGFGGVTAKLADLTHSAAAGALNEMPEGLKDSVTSLRWNLAPGVVVVLYEDAQGKGEQLALWGKGQSPTVAKWDFNDKASRWAWYDLNADGDANSESSTHLLPHGSTPPGANSPERSVELFRDKNFKGGTQQLSLDVAHAGEMQRVEGSQSDSTTSLRWNLPPGAIVVLHQDAGGGKQQVAIWGKGEIADLDVWDFNDKVSSWTWAYITPRTGDADHK